MERLHSSVIRDIRTMLSAYGLRLLDVEERQSLYHPHAGYHAWTDKGEVMLKPFIGTERRMQMVARYMRELWMDGCRFMPRWLSTISRKRYVRRNGRLYYVTEWVKGGQLETEADFHALGQALARLHAHTVNGGRHATQRVVVNLQAADRVFRTSLSARARSPISMVSDWLQEHGRTCERLSDEAWNLLQDAEVVKSLQAEDGRSTLIHGDVTCPNVIVTDDNVCLIDWDGVGPGSRWNELAKALANTADFDTGRLAAMLRGYAEVRPFTAAERRVVAALFRLPREAWRVARRAKSVRKRQIVHDFYVLEKAWQRRLNAVSWIDSWASDGEGMEDAVECRHSRA
ncbi:MAG: phosphotransferase [Alicyclobacillus sp.]|nr:phosphotransferase [Alicyclobacillus sp.]